MTDETPKSGELIGVTEAARILHRPRRTVAYQAKTGSIPVIGQVGPGQTWVFRRDAIEALANTDE